MAEKELAAFLRAELGSVTYDSIYPERILGYVRAYKHLQPLNDKVLKLVLKDIAWRASLGYHTDGVLSNPPDGRAEFEQMYQVGPIGHDSQGHAVVLERVGRIPAQRYVARFDEQSNLAHSIYNREAAVAFSRELSHAAGRRIVAITPLVDMKGMGMSHLRPEFLRLVKSTISTLIDAYPNAVTGFFVINAPMAFRALWKLIRPMLDKETLAKTFVLGGQAEYEKFFRERGIVLDQPIDGPISWSAQMRTRCGPQTPSRPEPACWPCVGEPL